MSGPTSLGFPGAPEDKARKTVSTRRKVSSRAAAGPAGLGVSSHGVEKNKQSRNNARRVKDAENLALKGKAHYTKRRHRPANRHVKSRAIDAEIARTDDADGHLIYKIGDGLEPDQYFSQGRYRILAPLGEGTFGKVVECFDRLERIRVAVKVVRNIRKYRDAARNEIEVLRHLHRNDTQNWYHCVRFFRCFDHYGHICMVFEKLGPSLYEYLREKKFRPFSLDQVRVYGFQLLEAVSFMHSLTLVHTDLKPENILLINSSRPLEIKLIDFGSSVFCDRHHPTVISTRHYRAPEVILGLEWSYACDLWSIGCVLLELFLGKAIFPTHYNAEHLAMMSAILGPFPTKMVRQACPSVQKHFVLGASSFQPYIWPDGVTSDGRMKSHRRVLHITELIAERNGDPKFLDLLRRLLTFDPDYRCTARDALQHPFFQGSVTSWENENFGTNYHLSGMTSLNVMPPTSVEHQRPTHGNAMEMLYAYALYDNPENPNCK